MLKTDLPNHTPSTELRIAVLCSIDHAPGVSRRERMRVIAERDHIDPVTGNVHRFTWRTIETWHTRYQKHGISIIERKVRSDRNSTRKISVPQLAEAIEETLPTLSTNKVGRSLRSVLYRAILKKGLLTRSRLAPTTFYRMIRDNDLLSAEVCDKLRQSFAMRYANEMWQADTMYGPTIPHADGSRRKTFLIAFIDDASRLITHAEWFFQDNTANMISAFRSAMYKRGKPERLYFDNGANYKASEIGCACLRLGIRLSHTPVRDGAAKGKIERFFRGFRDRFLTSESNFISLEDMNRRTTDWIENEYNTKPHRGIGMIPLDRFNIDIGRIVYLNDDEFSAEAFFHEETRMVNRTNCFTMHRRTFECPVHLAGRKISVRYDRSRMDRYVVYHRDHRVGEARPLNLHANADAVRKRIDRSAARAVVCP